MAINEWTIFEAAIDDARVSRPSISYTPRYARFICEEVLLQAARDAVGLIGEDQPIEKLVEECFSMLPLQRSYMQQSLGHGDTHAILVNAFDGLIHLVTPEFWRTPIGTETLEYGYVLPGFVRAATGGESYINRENIDRNPTLPSYVFVIDPKHLVRVDETSEEPPIEVDSSVQRRGRPEAFPIQELLEVTCFVLLKANLPSTQARFFSTIQTHYQEQGKAEPSHQTLRNKLGDLYERLLAAELAATGPK